MRSSKAKRNPKRIGKGLSISLTDFMLDHHMIGRVIVREIDHALQHKTNRHLLKANQYYVVCVAWEIRAN